MNKKTDINLWILCNNNCFYDVVAAAHNDYHVDTHKTP